MRLTLNVVVWAASIGLAGILGGAYVFINARSQAEVEANALNLRHNASSQVSVEVEKFINQGQTVALRLAEEVKAGRCKDPESCLLFELLRNEDLAEVTFTQGEEVSIDEALNTVLADTGRKMTSVFRATKDEGDFCTRRIEQQATGFVAHTRCRKPHQLFVSDAREVTGDALDPTRTPAFFRPAATYNNGKVLMTDLSYSQLDDVLPEAERRVVLVALLGVRDADEKLLGVLKVGVLDRRVRRIVQSFRVNREDPKDPYKIFIADDAGRLITGLDPDDKVTDQDDDLRIASAHLSPEVAAALKHESLKAVSEEKTEADGTFTIDEALYNVSVRYLAQSRDWRLVIVGPADFYLAQMRRLQQPLLVGSFIAFVLLFAGGLASVRVMRRALSQIQHETRGMSGFRFAATEVKSPFADVRETLFSLEQAKTAVRAMGRYVPLELVRKLFEENREPALGGTLREVSMFFTDIENFTGQAENEAPDVVAQWLGRYLEVMTSAVHAEDGTVDKFIGDAVMALWNAPRENPDHAVMACRAALRCQRETAKLYASNDWGGRQKLITRIGLHVGQVMVGHFGAPDRLNYTAIGDSVNLAARLEGLNKVYGTTLLASEEIQRRAKHAFNFRKLDVVAVKGKSQAIAVYELLGEASLPVSDVVVRYEQALGLYLAGNFAAALPLLLQNVSDPPSKVLAARCGELERHPPVQPWTGITFAQSK